MVPRRILSSRLTASGRGASAVGVAGPVGDMVCGLRGVAVEVGVWHRGEAAVPTDDIEDRALAVDERKKGILTASGRRVGCAINGDFQDDDAGDEAALTVNN